MANKMSKICQKEKEVIAKRPMSRSAHVRHNAVHSNAPPHTRRRGTAYGAEWHRRSRDAEAARRSGAEWQTIYTHTHTHIYLYVFIYIYILTRALRERTF